MGKKRVRCENCHNLMGSIPNIPNIGTWNTFSVLNRYKNEILGAKIKFGTTKLAKKEENVII